MPTDSHREDWSSIRTLSPVADGSSASSSALLRRRMESLNLADDLPFHQGADLERGFGVGENTTMSRIDRNHHSSHSTSDRVNRTGQLHTSLAEPSGLTQATAGQQAETGTAVVIDSDRSSAELLAHRLVTEGLVRSAQVSDSLSRGVAWADQLQSAVLITELLVGDENALSVAEQLREGHSGLRLVVLSRAMPSFMVNRLLTAQVAGCFAKTDPLTELLAGLRRVLRGERALSAGYGIGGDDSDPATQGLNRFLSRLSSQQFQVLIGLAQGLPAKEVANQIGSTAKAIDSLKYRLMKRLKLRSRVELTRWAIRQGLIQP